MNQRKKKNQRQIQYNSIGQRVYSTNIVGRRPLIHNIVKISPIVFKRKQATLNILLLDKTTKHTIEISTSNQSDIITKQTITIIDSETIIPRLRNSTKKDSIVLPSTYKPQQYENKQSKTTTVNSEKYNNSKQINNKKDNGTDNISVKRFNKEKINKRKHILKYPARTVQKNRSTNENKKINNKLNRPDEKNV